MFQQIFGHPQILNQARQYYFNTQENKSPSIQKQTKNDPDNNGSLTMTLLEAGQDKSFENFSNSGRSTGRRLRSQRLNTKTPPATSFCQVPQSVQITKSNADYQFKDVSSMDDFANMLIAKHESALYQSNENNESSYIPPINTANDSYFSVTSPKNQQSSSEKKEKSPIKDFLGQIEPFEDFACNLQEIHYQELSKTQQNGDQEAQSFYEDHSNQDEEEIIVRLAGGNKLLTSIQEYDESQEIGRTEQSARLTSYNYENTYAQDEQIAEDEDKDHYHDSNSSPIIVVRVGFQNLKNQEGRQSLIKVFESPVAEDNFGTQSPIKRFPIATSSPVFQERSDFHNDLKESQSDQSFSEGCKYCMVKQTELRSINNQQVVEILQENDARVELILKRHQTEVDVRNKQIEQLLAKIHLQNAQLHSKDKEINQSQIREQGLCRQLGITNAQHELKLVQLTDSHSQAIGQLTQEFEQQQNNIVAEYKLRCQRINQMVQQTKDQNLQLQEALIMKDHQGSKFRQDNQSMFADLKQLAQIEENLKYDINDLLTRNKELEQHSITLSEQLKVAQAMSAEQNKITAQKIESLKLQGQKAVRDSTLDAEKVMREVQLREQKLNQEIKSLREQNFLLESKAQKLESERINNPQERDRKNAELRQMHLELQRMQQLIQTMKLNKQSSVDQQLQFKNKVERQIMLPQKQVIQHADLSMSEWQQMQASSPFNAEMAFEQRTLLPYPDKNNTASPIKGRIDPNMAYARRQNLNLVTSQQDFENTLQDMSVKEMESQKCKLESEYSKIPITIISGKSIQMRKRKEELEYELDLIDKYISRAQLSFQR